MTKATGQFQHLLTRRRALAGAGALSLSAVGLGGCSGNGAGVRLIAGKEIDPEAIDRDPLAVLPSGIILLGYLDAQRMFGTDLGADVSRIVANVLPLGPESNFVASRDVQRVYGGVYAMQGVDFCSVVQGNFDEAAIERSADQRAEIAPGVPLVKTTYAGVEMYTAGNLGFVVLTSHTVLTGNEVGMRRALDRMRFQSLERAIPGWMVSLTETQNASFAVAGDFKTQPAVEATVKTVPFLAGLTNLRIIGNFEPPGLNFVGSLTYSEAAYADAGAANLRNLSQLTSFMNLLASWGVGTTIPPLEVETKGADVAFALPLDMGVVRTLVGLAAQYTSPQQLFGP